LRYDVNKKKERTRRS